MQARFAPFSALFAALLALPTSGQGQVHTGGSAPAASRAILDHPDSVCRFPQRLYPSKYTSGYRFGDVDGDGVKDLAVTAQAAISVYLGKGDGSFEAGQSIPSANGSGDLLLVDLDLDGVLDIAAGGVADVLTVHLGLGDGSFGPPAEFVGVRTNSMTKGDFDGDGLDDVVMASHEHDVYVLFNLGTGGVSAPTILASPGLEVAQHVLSRDVNGDGHDDILLPRETTITLWLGDSAGGFLETEQSLLTTQLTGARLYDMDGDGDSDLVTVDETAVTIYGNSGGVFSPWAPTLFSGTAIYSPRLAVGDFSGDGSPDVAAYAKLVGLDASWGRVFENDGAGVLAPAQELHGLASFNQLGAVDVEGDGDFDLVGIDYSSGIEVALNKGGELTTVAIVEPAEDINHIEVGDLDGDSIRDLIVAQDFGSTFYAHLGLGGTAFGPALAQPSGGAVDLQALAHGDLDSDGRLDVVVAYFTPPQVSVYFGAGDGTFDSAAHYPAPGVPRDCLVRDVDGDADLDVVFVTSWSGSYGLHTLLNNGDGTLAVGSWLDFVPGHDMAAADVDGDGDVDVLTNQGSSLQVCLNDGSGVFVLGETYDPGDYPRGHVLADWDGDGWPDQAWYADDSPVDLVGVRFNDGTGAFGPAQMLAPVQHVRSLAAADVNGDGALDLLGVGTQEFLVFTNRGNGSQTATFEDVKAHGVQFGSTLQTIELNGGGRREVVVADTVALKIFVSRCD